MFASIGFMMLFSKINRLRGTDIIEDLIYFGRPIYWFHRFFESITTKAWCCVWFGFVAELYIAFKYDLNPFVITAIGTITALGLLLWAVRGWGKYFSAYTGQNHKDDKEIAWIDYIGDLIKGDSYNINRLRGAVQMALRGWFYAQPMFIAFAVMNYILTESLHTSLGIASIGLLMLLQGFTYWVAAYFPHASQAAERNTGILIAICLMLVFNLMFVI